LIPGDEELTFAGVREISLEIGEFKCRRNALVTDINIDGILGLDFLQHHKGVVDIVQGNLTVHADLVF